jgi:NAD+ kinase
VAWAGSSGDRPAQLGLVVHPRRAVERAVEVVRDWASRHGVAVGQVAIPGQSRRVADPVDVAACDLVLAVGGDGTALAALHSAAPVSRPVLGVACGSLGVLTSVPEARLRSALELVAAGDWSARSLPGLEVTAEGAEERVALNDVAVVRAGTGQVITEIAVDGELYARIAGDGVVAATPLGSSAYTMAAGGPVLASGAEGIVITPLAPHGGVAPPLVVAPGSRVSLSVQPGYGGSRFEVDGQELGAAAAALTLSLSPDYATLVALADQEPLLTGLRRRGLVADAPRVLARDARDAADGLTTPPRPA